MSEWTKSARDTVDSRLRNHATRYAAEGAEATEVVDDLKRHIDQEVDRLGIPIVTEEDALRIMAGIDPALVRPAEQPAASRTPAPTRAHSRWATGALWFFAVILPAVAIGFEWVTKISGGIYVDPIPSWSHLLLLLLVPVSAGAVLYVLAREHASVPVWLRWSLSVATGVAMAYSVLFIPLTPFAFVGVIYFGIGLLPLSPLFAFLALLVLERRCRSLEESQDLRRHRPWRGALAALAVLGIMGAPGVLTSAWLDHSVRGSAEEKESAIRWLRLLGDEDDLLRACYWQPRGFSQEVLGLHRVETTAAQTTYYRVTGRAFNSVKPPLSSMLGTGRRELSEFRWDSNLGGEVVGGVVSGLSLASSRLDAMAHTGDGWGYAEWTLEFRNDHESSQREARAILQLPAGSVVSRVTLWVNGEEREAAFAGRSIARKAYQSVAVQQRRDPVLVTTAGPDRVLMQCFPIQPNGGVMRVRLGITAPLEALAEDRVVFTWPVFADRNFAIEDSLKHHAWLEIPNGTIKADARWSTDESRPNTVHATFSNRAIAGRLQPVHLRRTVSNETSWAKDDRSFPPVWIAHGLSRNDAPPVSRVALVFDGGPGGKELFEAARKALAASDGRGEYAVWMVKDGEHRIPATGAFSARSEMVRDLGAWKESFSGGHDPLPALEAAWDWAAGTTNGVVLWFHGAQPLVFGNLAGMSQRIERTGKLSPVVVDIVDRPVPDRLAEALSQGDHLRSMSRVFGLEEDLGRLLGQLDGSRPGWKWTLSRASAEPPAAIASRHLVRLWAKDESARLASDRNTAAAVALASRWQLVTPVSGAVVLETQEQFKAHGLEAVDPLTTPGVVPEPETWALLVVGSALVLWFHGRRRNTISKIEP